MKGTKLFLQTPGLSPWNFVATEAVLIQLSYTVAAKVGNENCIENVASNKGIPEVIPDHLFLRIVEKPIMKMKTQGFLFSFKYKSLLSS